MEHPIFGLYAIVDVDTLERLGLPVAVAAEALLDGGATVLQLRAKGRGSAEAVAWMRELEPLAHARNVPLFANDRADWAHLAGADGVHLGQEDMPLREVRREFPRLAQGVSTHNLAQLEVALSEGPDYVAFGPIFETRSKARPDPVLGLEALRQAVVRAAQVKTPLVAIGGLTESMAPIVSSLGAIPAVIAALMPESSTHEADMAEEIRRRTRRMREAIDAAQSRP